MKRLFPIGLLLLVLSFSAPVFAQAPKNDYVRTANYFLLSGHKLDEPETIRTLARFDLIILPAEAQVYNQTFFKTIRTLHPDILILAYVPSISWNNLHWNDPLHKKLRLGIRQDWWLKDANGNPKSVWPGTTALNLNSGWSDYLAQFVKSEILDTGLWNGIFYDEVHDSIGWIGAADTNADGTDEIGNAADAHWAAGYRKLLKTTRELIGQDALLLTNGSSNADFAPFVDGRMYENFPTANKPLSSWSSAMRDYLRLSTRKPHEQVTVVNANSANTGISTDYRSVRFAVTSTLLGNGFFGFDFGDQNHGQLWTYDEYGAQLGFPKNTPTNKLLSSQSISSFGGGVWEREFEKGKVVVNATETTQTVRLDGEYEKLHGTQDRGVNDGSIVSRVTLASKDGLILLRPIERIENVPFLNGSFARIFAFPGIVKRTGFFTYEPEQRGGVQIARYDLDGDGQNERIVADKTFITIFDTNGAQHARFAPYTDRYTLGVNFAVGDLEGDGSVEIVTGTDKDGPQMRIFNKDGNLIHPGFFAYDKNFRGGVKVAVGDLNGDGTKEIITGAGAGGGPHVRVFHKDGRALQPGFFAYDKNFRGGVNVASGDVDGDGKDEVITGPGAGGPDVRVFDLQGQMKVQFNAGTEGNKGLLVQAVDLDGDRIAEILGFTSDVFTLSLE